MRACCGVQASNDAFEAAEGGGVRQVKADEVYQHPAPLARAYAQCVARARRKAATRRHASYLSTTAAGRGPASVCAGRAVWRSGNFGDLTLRVFSIRQGPALAQVQEALLRVGNGHASVAFNCSSMMLSCACRTSLSKSLRLPDGRGVELSKASRAAIDPALLDLIRCAVYLIPCMRHACQLRTSVENTAHVRADQID